MDLVFLLIQIFSQIGVASAHAPCVKDAEMLCSDVIPGEGRIGRCLKHNKTRVSAECATYALSIKNLRVTIKEACYGDIRSHCAGLKPGNGRVFGCLKIKEQVSEKCKTELQRIQEIIK